jgi:peptide/nickel transport system permease protein
VTAIVKDHSREPSPLALPGLVVPGLGHLVPWAGTAWYGLQVGLTRLRLRGRRDAEARRAIMEAEDAHRAWFKRHGDHGDLIIGVGLVLHMAVLAWALVAGVPRPSAVFLDPETGDVTLHAVLATLYLVALVAGAWFIAYRRAFPRQLTEEQLNSNGQIFVRTMKKNRNGMIGLVGAALMIGIAFVTPYVAPFDPTDKDVIGVVLASPGVVTHPETGRRIFTLLGTDSVGRDLFSRVLYGARVSLSIGFIAILIAGTIGTALGAAAGYFGGWVDRAITWFIDLLLAIPRLVLLLAILGIFGTQDLTGSGKIFLIVVVLALTGWMGVSRIVRGQVLSLSRQDFIQAAQALGLSPLRIMVRHLVPNALAPVIVYASLAVGSTILLEASLSFLGLGISQPTPTWGSLVSDGRKVLLNSPWVATFPGLLIVWAVLSFNLLGDGLRDALDPKFRGK